MAEQDPAASALSDEDERMARIIARGFDIHEEAKAERDAKAQAAKDKEPKPNDNGDKPPARSFRDRLLG